MILNIAFPIACDTTSDPTTESRGEQSGNVMFSFCDDLDEDVTFSRVA